MKVQSINGCQKNTKTNFNGGIKISVAENAHRKTDVFCDVLNLKRKEKFPLTFNNGTGIATVEKPTKVVLDKLKAMNVKYSKFD